MFLRQPAIVEWTDVTAADPRLLYLRSYHNTVPIPVDWSAKHDYLQDKRGIEKPPFQLPAYIADTGIATMRDAVKEKEANMNLKAKTRKRVQWKMGKVARSCMMCPPSSRGFGETYHESKEFETSLKEKCSGDLSPELGDPLNSSACTPPWLINLQLFGPSSRYPTLQMTGLNAPYLRAPSGVSIQEVGESHLWTSTIVRCMMMSLVSCQKPRIRTLGSLLTRSMGRARVSKRREEEESEESEEEETNKPAPSDGL